MANRFAQAKVGFSGDRSALAVGNYGSNKLAGLEIVSFVGAKATKDPELMRLTYLVASTDGQPGTAFLTFNINYGWLKDEILALAFNLEGVPDKETLEAALGIKLETEADEKQAREGILAEAEQALRAKASARAMANNAPETAEKLYENALTAIRISVGTVFRLQDWQGYDRDALMIQHAPEKLMGCTFGGKVKESNFKSQPTEKNPDPGPTMEVDVYTFKGDRGNQPLKTYSYTVKEEVEKAPF
jgi:hypothetical protein